MWSTVRENLNNLATASGKDTAHILKALHKQVLDKLDPLRPTLKELERSRQTIHSNMARQSVCSYTYHSRVDSWISKWLTLLATIEPSMPLSTAGLIEL
jgi:hypothetical protein